MLYRSRFSQSGRETIRVGSKAIVMNGHYSGTERSENAQPRRLASIEGFDLDHALTSGNGKHLHNLDALTWEEGEVRMIEEKPGCRLM